MVVAGIYRLNLSSTSALEAIYSHQAKAITGGDAVCGRIPIILINITTAAASLEARRTYRQKYGENKSASGGSFSICTGDNFDNSWDSACSDTAIDGLLSNEARHYFVHWRYIPNLSYSRHFARASELKLFACGGHAINRWMFIL